tara:strand:- start:233 stop:940 length:708 start_codon:yes stop_codon:yes gene_type:complete
LKLNFIKRPSLLVVIVTLFLGSVCQLHADSIHVIDSFTSGASASLGGVTSVVDDGLHSDVIGGYRDVSLSGYGSSVTVGFNNGLNVQTAPSSFAPVSINYNGLANAGLNLNLLDVGTEGSFTFENFQGQGPGELFFDIRGGGVTGGYFWQFVDNNVLGVSSNDLVVDFQFLLSQGVDLTNVQSISFSFLPADEGTSFSLSSITATTLAVPEPTTACMLGVGSLLLLRRRRRPLSA